LLKFLFNPSQPFSGKYKDHSKLTRGLVIPLWMINV